MGMNSSLKFNNSILENNIMDNNKNNRTMTLEEVRLYIQEMTLEELEEMTLEEVLLQIQVYTIEKRRKELQD